MFTQRNQLKQLALLLALPASAGVAYCVYRKLYQNRSCDPASINLHDMDLDPKTNYVKKSIPVPREKAGAIIGVSGSVIRQMEMDLNVKMRLENHTSNCSDDNLNYDMQILTINGQKDDVIAAIVYVNKILDSIKPTVKREISVPKEAVGMIIGKNGSTVREISMNSGAKIQIAGDGHGGSNMIIIYLAGTEENINRAEELIGYKIEEYFGKEMARKTGNSGARLTNEEIADLEDWD